MLIRAGVLKCILEGFLSFLWTNSYLVLAKALFLSCCTPSKPLPVNLMDAAENDPFTNACPYQR